MQKRVAPFAFAMRAFASTSSRSIRGSGLTPGFKANALRTIRAVFGTGAGLDGQQRADLHLVRIEVGAMHALRVKHEVGERQRK